MDNFKLACKELKDNGKGYIKNYKDIDDEGNYIKFQSFITKITVFFHFKKLDLDQNHNVYNISADDKNMWCNT